MRTLWKTPREAMCAVASDSLGDHLARATESETLMRELRTVVKKGEKPTERERQQSPR